MATIRELFAGAALLACTWADAQLGVINAEYFWDSDPGPGNGTAMTAADGGFGSALETAIANTAALPATGTHTFHVRVKDEDNAWGPVFSLVIDLWDASTPAQDINVQEAEYFWDTDPGQGNGAPMVAFDGAFTDALEAIAFDTGTLPASGTHVVGIRARDVNNDWGPVFSFIVEVWDGTISFPDIQVQNAEYYLDTDPGAGAGTPFLVADGAFDTAVESLAGGGIPVPVTNGIHVLYMRAQDVHGDWGPSFGVVVNIDTTITGTVAVEGPIAGGDHLNLYPNPADAVNSLTVDLGAHEEDIVLTLTDADGRIVRDLRIAAASMIQLPLTGLASGVYSMRVNMTGRAEKRKLVVR